MSPINSVVAPLTLPETIRERTLTSQSNPSGTAKFSEMLAGMVGSANQSAHYAQGLSEAFAAGARDDIHGTMIAMSKADIELRLISNVRNKITDAFYELWRMQI